jgi:hypothetical protein
VVRAAVALNARPDDSGRWVAGDRSVDPKGVAEDPMCGPGLVRSWELTDGAWKELPSIATWVEAGDEPCLELDALDAAFRARAWTVSTETYTSCARSQDCETHDLGDSPHAMPPVFWCADRSCATRTPLAGLPSDGQLAIQPHGDQVLIVDEFSADHARLYAFGKAEPLWDVGGVAAWLPDGANP